MNIGIKVQKCNFLPEGEMAIIKDTNTLIHNIVNSELKEKDKEIDRLNNIINELEKSIKDEYDYCDRRTDPAFGVGMGVSTRILDKLKELKEKE